MSRRLIRGFIFSLSREEQARYADIVTEVNCTNPAWVRNQVAHINPTRCKGMTSTSIGNLAYLLLHGDLSDDEKIKIHDLMCLADRQGVDL